MHFSLSAIRCSVVAFIKKLVEFVLSKLFCIKFVINQTWLVRLHLVTLHWSLLLIAKLLLLDYTKWISLVARNSSHRCRERRWAKAWKSSRAEHEKWITESDKATVRRRALFALCKSLAVWNQFPNCRDKTGARRKLFTRLLVSLSVVMQHKWLLKQWTANLNQFIVSIFQSSRHFSANLTLFVQIDVAVPDSAINLSARLIAQHIWI